MSNVINLAAKGAQGANRFQTKGIKDASDTTVAGLFLAQYGQDHRYIRDGRYWIQWRNGGWKREDSGQGVFNDLAELRARLLACNQTEQVSRIVNKLSNHRSLSGIYNQLCITGAISLAESELDTYPELIAFSNAVFNTGNLHLTTDLSMIRKLYLLRKMDVEYEPGAECPLWLEFLDKVFDRDQELIAFVQKAVALALSGEVMEELLFFAYGSGANGKTTFFETIRRLFGDYHCEIDPFILINSRGADQRLALENIARLKGVRFATSNEIPERASYNDQMIKQLSSRDEISAKRIYQSVTSFAPSHKLWIRSNHKPDFNIRDGGMLRRICPLPFGIQIPAPERIERYEDLLLGEKSGILNWMLEGWNRYRQERIRPFPAAVNSAMSEYISECDTLSQFLQESCQINDMDSVTLKSFTDAFNLWLGSSGYGKTNSRRVGDALREKNFTVNKGSKGKTYVYGVSLDEIE